MRIVDIKTIIINGSKTIYDITADGQIINNKTGRRLRYYIDNAGYKTTNIRFKGKVYKIKHHLAVARAFIGERPKGYIVNHIDHNKSNNDKGNLEIITYSGNTKAWHIYRKEKARKDGKKLITEGSEEIIKVDIEEII